MPGNRVQVNGNTSGYDPNTQNLINQALLLNGGVKRIQETMQQRLDEAGWSQNLREYIQRLFRSDECRTYDEAREKIMQQINSGGEGLAVPEDAKQDTATIIKKELAKICKNVDG